MNLVDLSFFYKGSIIHLINYSTNPEHHSPLDSYVERSKNYVNDYKTTFLELYNWKTEPHCRRSGGGLKVVISVTNN